MIALHIKEKEREENKSVSQQMIQSVSGLPNFASNLARSIWSGPIYKLSPYCNVATFRHFSSDWTILFPRECLLGATSGPAEVLSRRVLEDLGLIRFGDISWVERLNMRGRLEILVLALVTWRGLALEYEAVSRRIHTTTLLEVLCLPMSLVLQKMWMSIADLEETSRPTQKNTTNVLQ